MSEMLVSVIPSLLAVIAVWVNLNKEVEKLKGRVIHLESDKDDMKEMLKEVVTAVHKIELLLAKK